MSITPQNILPNQSNVDTNSNKNLSSKYLLKSVVESPNPNDDSIIDLNYEKKLTTIDYDKMKHTVKSTHATNINGEYYTCKEACWSFNPGNHRCVGSSEKSDMTKFGVGITLYFKFVKRLILFFFLFTLLSIPAYVFYTSSFATYTKAQDSLSYIDLLTATTVGSVGLGSTSCAVRKLKTGTDKQRLLQFQCPGGKIADVNNIVYGLVKQGTTCTFVDTSELVVSCNTYDMNALRTALKDCIGAKDCKITVPTDIFKTGDSNCDQLYNTMNVYMKVACEVKTIKLGKTSQLVVQKSTVAYVVAALDAVIIVIFLVMLYTLKFAQKNAVTNIQKRTYSASSYTVEFLNLPQNMAVEELSAKLWVFLDQKLGEKSVEAGHRVVDVQIVLPNKLIEYNKKVGMLIHKKNELTRYFIETYVPDYAKKQIDYDGLKAIMQEIIERNHPKAKEAEKVFSHIRKLAFKKMKTLNEIQKLKTVKEVKIVSAFVTFSSIPARDKILDSFINSPLERLMRMMCTRFFDKNVSFYGKILRARTSSDPGSILWENLGEPGPKVFARRAVSAVLTLILWAFSGTILIISTYYKNDFRKNFPTIDCSDQTVTAGQAGDDYLLGEYQSGLLECYCQQDLVNNLYHQFSRVDNQTLCLTWFTNRVIETSITLAIVFVVLIVNYFVQFVFQALSKFEKHSTFNKQITTRVFKTFVAQFLNTGLMILIVNIKFDISFWQGQFRDISPLWYQNVGSTLLSTMFINILTIPSVRISFVLLQKIKRFCDRRCKSDERITRKKTQEAYEKLYSGPEFIIDFRYSQMLTLTFVCFLYSGGMPLLYFSSFLQLVITYFFDKVYLLKVNKLPRNYDQSLEAAVRPAMYIALVIHLVFAIFMFGNNEIFSQSVVDFVSLSASVTSITENISNDDANVVTKFFKRTVLNFNVVLTILLLVIIALFLVKDVLIGVLRKTFLTFFTTDEEKTQKNGKKVNPIMLANSTFFHALQTEDLAKLIKLTKITLKTTQNQELAQQLQSKLALLRQEYLTKKQEIQQPMNFIGFYSYDVRLQDRYAAQFGIEEMLERETLD